MKKPISVRHSRSLITSTVVGLSLLATSYSASAAGSECRAGRVADDCAELISQMPAQQYTQPAAPYGGQTVYPGQSQPYGQTAPAGQSYPGGTAQPYAYPGQLGQPYGAPAQAYPADPSRTNPGLPTQQSGAEPAFSLPWSGQGPIIVPPIRFVDVNSGRFGKLEIDLEDGHFMEGAVDRLHFVAQNMDLTSGSLASLAVEVKGGHFEDFTCDHLTLSSAEGLSFDTGILLNHRMLQFSRPAQAEVTAVVTSASLVRFLNSPRTLERLSINAVHKGGLLSNMLGQLGGNAVVGLTFSSGNLSLEPNNRMLVSMQSKVGMGELAAPLPIQLDTRLVLKDGWVNLADTRILASGQEISPELSAMVVARVNALASWGTRSDDIHFVFTTLKVVPGDRLVLSGVSEIRRLRF